MRRTGRFVIREDRSAEAPPTDDPKLDTSEQVSISPLALLKMLIHAGAEVPVQVMGLMLGEFVDEYTVRVVDVFAMPRSGTGVSFQAIDLDYQTNMTNLLRTTERSEMVVGWYRSRPRFGCWLSTEDISTQQVCQWQFIAILLRAQSFEADLHPRAVAVVIDPIQSVKGKVEIGAFRLINPKDGRSLRQTTSNVWCLLEMPSIRALIKGLGLSHYSIVINYRKNKLEEKMLLNLKNKMKWSDGFKLRRFDIHSENNERSIQEMLKLTREYEKAVQEEDELPPEELEMAKVGKQDPKKHLEEHHVSNLMTSNIVQIIGTMLDSIVF